ncbi:ABC transporter ATP-binding protein [Ponticaulis sp.]|uniref:ABC transporter ATP-binding protein n=1 Tax=Ponticaulis sp. TaxID=2020902 RepID=UPI000B66145E|nr:ABC transporter ATP-binding protein [Ponticaulis sp.]MAI90671.1 multidrug ABC transporter ATP-binding protein [Ponticaulis sp.]OUX99225.1 MAG: multidrug ABC transporter ATP-binding protein [Hyphomonadaceae bacterium TMED5]|tara:strand:+ start:35167 stop:36105 length:939 start_codon:yes stop_codon:yes gene_type:complete
MSGDSDLAIDVRGLVKRFGDKAAVNGVDIQMPRGKVWGFLGPNGSGKTTTIRMICGLLKISEGEGSCLGYDIKKDASRIKLKTGYMTQKFSFWSDLTIRENLEFVARLYQLPKMKRVVDETLEGLGLAHRQRQLAGALSGGWKQRLALAAVTMHGPDLLLLDEPTAGVDPQARRDFWDEIHHLSRNGMTVLVSTHYMDEAERCDRIVYLANGQKVTEGRVQNIIDRSGLVTWRAEGDAVRDLSSEIEGQDGAEHVAYFGSALHVSGTDEARLRDTISHFQRPDVEWHEVRPSLEDAFIALMARAGVDQRDHG